MKDPVLDSNGDLRCWHCGSKNFIEKRTARAKMLVGIGALVTKKKLKCASCGEYNDSGNAKPMTGKERWAKKEAHSPPATPPPAAVAGVADELSKLVALRDAGALSADEFETQKARLLG